MASDTVDQETADAVLRWKTRRFRPGEIPLAEAVASLTSPSPLIEARQSPTRKSDWVLCRAGTSVPAVFVFAGVFAEADPYETGNLVWGKAPTPDGLEDSRITRYAGFKGAYSYAIETYHEKEIWELQETLDAYMINVPGFNSRGVKRREWQNGKTWHLRHYLRTPMFFSCEARGGKPDAPPGVHDWVAAAHKKSKTYRANPVRPAVCGLVDGRLESIDKCTPNELEYGDVVSIVFGLTYVEDREDWGPVPMLTHIIRVQHANRDVYQLTSQLADVMVDDGLGALPLGMVLNDEHATCAGPAAHANEATETAEPPAAVVLAEPPAAVVLAVGTSTAHRDIPRAAPDTSSSVVIGKRRSADLVDDSGSEMEVDDDGGGTNPSGTGGDADLLVDAGFSSGASTLTDASTADNDGDVQSQKRKKKRKMY